MQIEGMVHDPLDVSFGDKRYLIEDGNFQRLGNETQPLPLLRTLSAWGTRNGGPIAKKGSSVGMGGSFSIPDEVDAQRAPMSDTFRRLVPT